MNEEYISNEIAGLVEAVKAISEMDEDILEQALPQMKEELQKRYNSELREQSINQLINNLEDQRLDRNGAAAALSAAADTLRQLVKIDEMKPNQQAAAQLLLDPLFTTFEEALARYHLYNIDLPLKLEKGAQAPTYAHDTDAAADLYALEDTVLKGPSLGNKIRTGVSIQLPEGWLAMIIPRSSIGAKTPLRLSNSVGLIDSGYRGELGVLYDNIDVNDVTIHKGDRIAQLLVMPSYRFQPKVVDILEDSDRGEGGFGSTGT